MSPIKRSPKKTADISCHLSNKKKVSPYSSLVFFYFKKSKNSILNVNINYVYNNTVVINFSSSVH
jgi:hypothetical protein